MSVASNYRPTSLDGIIGQEVAVKLIQAVVQTNCHSDDNTQSSHIRNINRFLLSGKPGTGKTTLAVLYARATLCPHREKNSWRACGKCDICLGKVSNNIHHYTIKNSTEAVGPINDLIELSRYKPQPTYPNARPDQIRQFIIIDELENATAELISRLLEPLENGNSSTSWVLCTMDLNKLKKRNPAVAEAIISRCTLLEFNALSEEYISNCLHKTYSELNLSDEARLAIAKLAEGNLRKAHDLVSNISLLTSTEGVDITEQFINETFLGGFTIDNRKKFWKALCLSDKDNMVNSLNLYCRNADPKLIANILVEDLITYSTLNQIPSDTINLLRDLSMWFTNPLTPLCWVFFPYLGCKLF